MKESICIIIPYFGKLPPNICTYLMTCKKNNKIDWFIFTDDDENIDKYKNFCSNVYFIKSSLQRIRNRIKQVTDLQYFVLNKPYKLCDYKPLYGLIFRKYTKNYDYWGYSDLDIVYGNLFKFIGQAVFKGYLKIGTHGHFMLYKNNKLMNHLYEYPIINNGCKYYLFKNFVSQTSKICHFDEFSGINIICKQNGIDTYDSNSLVNDISFENLDLKPKDKRFISKYSCYIWDNGSAKYFYKKNGNIYMHEYGYFHFQKRHDFHHFVINLNNSCSHFSITTYGYRCINDINSKSINLAMNRNRSSFIRRLMYILHWYVFNRNIFHINIKHVFKRIFVDNNFKI